MLPKVTLVAVVNGLIGEPTGTVTPRVTGMKRVKFVVPRNFEIAEQIERMVGRDLTVQADR